MRRTGFKAPVDRLALFVRNLEVSPIAGRRIRAYAFDCLGYLGIAAATLPFGLLLLRAGWGGHPGYVLALSAVPPAIASVVAAGAESSRSSTPGKRRQGLAVRTLNDSNASPSFGAAVVRNVLKIGIPWQLGHLSAIGGVYGGFERSDPWTVAATASTYTVVAVMLWGLLHRSGVTVHDRLTATRVITAPAPQHKQPGGPAVNQSHHRHGD